MTDLGPVRLLAVDESMRIARVPEVGEPLLVEVTQWLLVSTRTYRNSRGQLALPYAVVPLKQRQVRPRWIDFENAFDTLADIPEHPELHHAE